MSEKLFFTGIDLQQNQLKNAVIHPLATAPENAVEGQIYFDTVNHKLMEYNGTQWQPVCADALTVAAGSSDYLAIVNGELSIKALAITNVTVDATETSIANFVTANYTGSEFQEGDVVILTAASDGANRYIHNGGTAGTTADFTVLDNVLSSSEVRGYLSASDGISYNSGTGEFTLADDGVTQAKLDATLEAKIVNAFKSLVGNGSATSFNINHGLNTEDIFCHAWKVSTGEHVECQIVIVDANNITVGAFPAPSTNNLKILIQKAILS